MSDELKVCAAALFLNKGKDVLTVKEFTMYVSLDLRWMQVKDANLLLDAFVKNSLVSKTDGYLRPAVDISSIEVPVAYRPSEDLLNEIRKGQLERPAKVNDPADVLQRLVQAALDSGMEKGAFISECNKVRKRTNVDMEVAALMILRERDVDIMPFIDDVRSSVLSR
ncbi:MAG: DUF2240 family protein [Candidatus Methanoplasma sp.]|jgi:hypothetical protein|nr:DUF2240 family protein [Candidatus Methanoplasma sp.]